MAESDASLTGATTSSTYSFRVARLQSDLPTSALGSNHFPVESNKPWNQRVRIDGKMHALPALLELMDGQVQVPAQRW